MSEAVINKTSEYFKKKGIILPKISELCNPDSIAVSYTHLTLPTNREV